MEAKSVKELIPVSKLCEKHFHRNEVLIDEEQNYLERLNSKVTTCPEELSKELMTKHQLCRDVFHIYMRKWIMSDGPPVHYMPCNTLLGLKAQLKEIQLTDEMKTFMKELSAEGHKLLKECKFLEEGVELDAERCGVALDGDIKIRIMGMFDCLCLREKDLEREREKNYRQWKRRQRTGSDLSKQDHLLVKSWNSKDMELLKDNDLSDTMKMSKKLCATKITEEKILSDNENVTSNEKAQYSAFISFIITPRAYVPVSDIFKQLILHQLHSVSGLFLLVGHLGPLVEKQELILYEYCLPSSLKALITDNDLNINNLAITFRRIKGRQLQQLTDIKDYLRYLVYDFPGVSETQQERSERHRQHKKKKFKEKEKIKSSEKKEEI
ncbi:hypothetical protein CHS0354_042617 [Potamilus streckersoni]|uniref:Uncharacterized protein n=1 Tax=Potamilus streckersoni TaxID=2493646 RepID=A0AAE0TE19_9BIVA|nr:hypothetical protein CHS0354_042617 [Potamilus streckersoni]